MNRLKLSFKIFFVLAVLLPLFTFAQSERSYHYEAIRTSFDVRADSTVSVKEEQTYKFVGEYHQGWRSIPHKSVSAITDVSVMDTATGEELTYSSRRLDKTNPSSWGKYTVYTEDGATNIEWYYNLKDTTHTWLLRYTLHGAIAFYKDHDELYWNLFTDYEVPVDLAEASIWLPGEVTQPQASFYTSEEHAYTADRPDKNIFHFAVSNIAPQEDVTFAVGWQKGLVDQSAFWVDFLHLYYGYIAAILIAVFALLYAFMQWFFTERFHKGRGTIIAEYEPPEHLRPAVAQLLVTEHSNAATWPATLVDLAVRGYIKIVEEKKGPNLGKGLLTWMFEQKGYRVEKVKEYAADPGLAQYEKKFLDILFAQGGDYLSTLELKKSQSQQSAMYTKMNALKEDLYKEASLSTNAYEVPLTAKKKLALGVVAVAVAVGILLSVSSAFSNAVVQGVWVLVTVAAAYTFVRILHVYNPRLSQRGFILRDDWKGFVLYLKTAEQLRLQNLTPDLFEKYLPYAMIFKLEKQWAKAFDSMNLRPPQWYAGSAYVGFSSGSGSGSGSSGFSPSGFSASFSSSFASAFSSSGASGSSGGGGGAGGGGGGGGGGAS